MYIKENRRSMPEKDPAVGVLTIVRQALGKSGKCTCTAAAKERGLPLSTFRYRAEIYKKAKLL